MEKKYLGLVKKYEDEAKNVDELKRVIGNYHKEVASLRIQLDDEVSARVKIEKEFKNFKTSTTSKQVTFGDNEIRQTRKTHQPSATVLRRVGDINEIGMPYLSPYDLDSSKTTNQPRRSSIQQTSQGQSYSTRTNSRRDGSPDDDDGDDDDDDDDPRHNGDRGDDRKRRDREDRRKRKDKKRGGSGDDGDDSGDDPSIITGKGYGKKSARTRSVRDEEEDLTTFETYYGGNFSAIEEEFLLDSLETRPDTYLTKDLQHIIVMPYITSVPKLCKAKMTSILKDLVGKIDSKKACDAGNLIVRLRI